MIEENTLPKVKRVCIECGSDTTYTQTTKRWHYEMWRRGEKYGKDGWLCLRCYQRLGRQLGFIKKEDQRHSIMSSERLKKKLDYHKKHLKEWRKNNPGRYRQKIRQYNFNLKIRLMLILNQYACVYCGCQLFPCLQFDHKNSGGTRDLKRFGTSIRMKIYYINHPEEARKTLQVCCANCNWLKKWRNNEDATLVLTDLIA